MENTKLGKRSRSRSPPPWRRPAKSPRPTSSQFQNGFPARREQGPRLRNQIKEDVQMREWVSKEDEFVLKQSKKKAQIRVREGRAKAIDWLTVILSVIDPTRDLLEDDETGSEIEIMAPDGVIEGLSPKDLQELEKEIDHYLVLETNKSNRAYWNAMKVICKDRRTRMDSSGPGKGAVNSVLADVEQLLGPKTLDQLRILKGQVKGKLESNEPIDVEYWEQLLGNIEVYQAKAELKSIYQSVLDGRLQHLKRQQIEEAQVARDRLGLLIGEVSPKPPTFALTDHFDPEPLLKIRAEDKALEVIEESTFLDKIIADRCRVQKMGYVPMRPRRHGKQPPTTIAKPADSSSASGARFSSAAGEDFSQATKALYDREVARGVQEDEEIFAGEEDVTTVSKTQWEGKYRPRKPRYFNRVHMGYEWNKYNQTHYDHGNPPPKVVHGYKFNIFYPDLIDKAKAPTYRIERENGRKRGQSFAPAGEEDTCLIRFVSGPPYEDLAFRIVDKEWDYSAKRERGFRSSFDKGILQLHFQFKKVYYRK